jgi:hypothetical protein
LVQTFALQLGVGVLAGALALFGGTQLLGGSGYLAVYLCGVVLMERIAASHRQELQVTHDSLAWRSQIVMFLLLGVLVTPHELTSEILAAPGVAGVLNFIAGPSSWRSVSPRSLSAVTNGSSLPGSACAAPCPSSWRSFRWSVSVRSMIISLILSLWFGWIWANPSKIPPV